MPEDATVAHAAARGRELPEAMRRRYIELGITDVRTLNVVQLFADLARFNSRTMNDFDQVVARSLDITWAGYRIMNSLLAFGGLDQQALARLSGTSRAATSGSLSTLERKGLITRTAPETDRRRLVVQLTDAGREILERAVQLQSTRLDAWTQLLGTDEITRLRELLKRLADQPAPPS